MNKFKAVARVKCMGRHHRIALTNSGKLSLLDHPENDEALDALLVFNPAQRCRCKEIRKIWNWYILGDSARWYDIHEDHEWVEEAFKSRKRGYFDTPTPSRILGQLPIPLRDYAVEARKKREDRRYYPPRPAVSGKYKRMKAWELNHERRKLQRYRINRVLELPRNYDGIPIPDTLQFRNEKWFRSLESCNLFPSELPPLELWPNHDDCDDSYPPFLRAWRKHGDGEVRYRRYDEIWVRLQFLPATPDSPSQFTVIRKGQNL